METAQFWQFGLVGVLAVAMVTDYRSHKIYNWLTFPAMAAGLAVSFAMGGVHGLGSSLLGFFAASFVFALGFFTGQGIRAGDVKLMAAIGTWLGWQASIASVLYVAIVGGVVSLAITARLGTMRKLFKNVYWSMVGLTMRGGSAAIRPEDSAADWFPYGISIGIGTMLALVFPEPAHLLRAVGLVR